MDYNKEILCHKMLLSNSTLRFTRGMFQYLNKTPFIVGAHHRMICDALDRVVKGGTRKLMINIGPRYGKTELCSKQFIAYGFAINPQSNFLHLSYSGGLTMENSMGVKDIIKSDYYKAVYETRIKPSEDSRAKWSTVQGGKMYATSTLGQITGFGAGRTDKEESDGEADDEQVIDEFFERFNPDGFAGAIVIDDPIKPQDALSENVRETVNRRFETTIRNRVNSRKTPIIIIMQRLHEHDLCGYLLDVEPNEWEVLKIPVISYDENGEEVALWPFKHTIDELHHLRDINSWVFDTQYMQEPKPIEGLLFPKEETKYFEVIPDDPEVVFIQMDPADEGDNMYCSKVYYIKDGYCLNVDVIYTEDKLEITMPRLKEQILKWKPSYVNVESNSAWRLVAKEIKEWAAEYAPDSEVRRHNATANKENRIFNEAPTIRNRFLYLTPSKQNKEYKRCMDDMHRYLKMVKDQRDDCVDVDAAASFWAKRNKLITLM